MESGSLFIVLMCGQVGIDNRHVWQSPNNNPPASDSLTQSLGQLAITPSNATVTEAIKGDNRRHSIYKLPTEIRQQVFISSAHHFPAVERDLRRRRDLARDLHEHHYPDLVFEWDPLLDPDEYQGQISKRSL